MVSHWSDSGSPQVSRTLLNILVDLDNGVVGMVSTCLLISKSTINPLEDFSKYSKYNRYHHRFHVL